MKANRYGYLVFFSFILSLGLIQNASAADVPMLMNYQGKVTDSSGVPVNGDGFFKFSIVNEAGDTTYWANDGTTVNGAEPTTAITIPVSDGRFTVKLGDAGLVNMASLSPAVFENTSIFLRVWFSTVDSTSNFEQFATDMQIVSNGFAVKSQSVDYSGLKNQDNTYLAYKPNNVACTNNQILTWDATNSRWICDDIPLDPAETDPTVPASIKDGISWAEVGSRPAGLDDGDDVGITTEADPTVPAAIKDGISWSEVGSRPAGLDDGDDVGITTEADPTVPAAIKDGISWTEVANRPAGLDDGDDSGMWEPGATNTDAIYNAGKVGIGPVIGTSFNQPTQLVHIQNSEPSTTAINPLLFLHNRSNTRNATAGIFFGNSSIATYVKQAIFAKYSAGLWGVGELHFALNPVSNSTDVNVSDSKMMIQAGGNVGIGTTTPTFKLQVNGTAGKTGGGVWSVSSDLRLKDVNGNYQKGLEEITQLRPVVFNYKADNDRGLPSDTDEIGFVAQEVKNVFPEAVSEGEDGYLNFNMHPLNVAIINAIKELKAENKALRERIEDLENER